MPRRQKGSQYRSQACERCRARHKRCDAGPPRSICSNCRKADVQCNTALRIRVGGSSTERWTSSILEDQSHGTEVANAHRTRPSVSPSRDESRSGMESSISALGMDTDARRATPSKPKDMSVFPAHSPSFQAGGTALTEHLLMTQQNVQSKAIRDLPACPSADQSPDANACSAIPTGETQNNRAPHNLAFGSSPAHDLPHTGANMSELNKPVSTGESTGRLDFNLVSQPLGPCLWPVGEAESRLIKYFFNVLVAWFDFCDPQMSFRSYIGTAISNHPALLYAVLAVSARHCELTKGVGYSNSYEYQQQCLEILIPSLNDTTAVLQDGIIASALLLRLLDEMTEPSDQQTMSNHAVSTTVLLKLKRGNVQSNKFSDAAMIVALRQEILVANMTKRTVEAVGDFCNITTELTAASDTVWSCRSMLHAARVTSFVYGVETLDKMEWDRLWQYTEAWEAALPDSFRPIYHACASPPGSRWSSGASPSGHGSSLPKIIFTYDCPLAGFQYMQLSRILLLAFNPRRQILGVGSREFLSRQDEEIRQAVRAICGAAVSNPEYMPAKITAGLSIAMCGEMFSDPEETCELLRISSEAEIHMMWPRFKVSQALRAFWHLP